MSEWQPIETAPKDGTKLDLWGVSIRDDLTEKHMRVADAFWSQGFDARWATGAPMFPKRIPYFRPTHYMLPPDPPT